MAAASQPVFGLTASAAAPPRGRGPGPGNRAPLLESKENSRSATATAASVSRVVSLELPKVIRPQEGPLALDGRTLVFASSVFVITGRR